MIRRARLIAVLATVIAGGVGVISSTQTWLYAHLTDTAADALPVAGNVALQVLAPLSLAALALGAALALVGRIARYVFGGLAVVLSGMLLSLTLPISIGAPVSAVARTVTEKTGIAGDESVAALVASIEVTAWPWVAVIGFVLLGLAGVLVLTTSHRWRTGGRRYAQGVSARPTGAPLDAVDSWDDLSRGDDPTR